MANIYKGVGVNFGINSSITSATGSFQTSDHGYRSEVELVKNGTGNTVAKIYFDQSEEATYTYIATGATGSGSVSIAVPTIGQMVTIADSTYSAIDGTSWLVDNVDVARVNNSSAKVTLKLSKYPNITA
jgi:hypothetical protein